jgi:outer membrane receptor for ferrienterochelin and colicins
MNRGRLNSTVALLALGGPSSALAAPADELLDLSLDQLMDVKVVSASREVESLAETPVPVTVITREMIERSGVRNLRDALVTFVPGYTNAQDHNELNVAVRGVYGSSQQKILILRDGHRLNSRAYSSAPPDYSIGLDSIERIEILRGPGSSLYGNVALGGVVNLITRDAKKLGGTEVTLGFGAFDAYRGSVVIGQQFDEDHALTLWGTAYAAAGERVDVPADRSYEPVPRAGEAWLGRFADPLSYDVGATYRFGELRLLASRRAGSYASPFTDAGSPTGRLYDREAIRTMFGIGTGVRQTSTHLGLGLDHVFESLGGVELDVYGYFDASELRGTLVIDPTTATAGFLTWDEYDLGAIVQLRKAYTLLGQGSILIGGQVDGTTLYDSAFPIQTGGEWTRFGDSSEDQLLEVGSEQSLSAFAQIRHELTPQLLFNAGARYDIKQRLRGDDIHNLSPRIAVVWLPADVFSLKASFAQSFVDAPYWYRYNSLASYRGGEFLRPERLSAAQLTPTLTFLDGRLKATANLFYSYFADFIFRNNAAAADEPIYQNAGHLAAAGVENEVSYSASMFKALVNATYQRAVDAENYGTTGAAIHAVPSLTANAVLDFNPLWTIGQELWLNLTLRYVGSQFSPISVAYAGGPDYSDPDFEVDAAFVVNAGIRWTLPGLEQMKLDARVFNALDAKYFQGGSVQHPYPQPGRWWQLSATARF